MAQAIFPFSTSATLPASYGQGLYQNLQALSSKQRAQQEGQVQQGYAGPSNIAGTLQQLQGLDEGFADQGMQQGAGVLSQMAGTDIDQRRIGQKRNFTRTQSELNRLHKMEMLKQNVNLAKKMADEDQSLSDGKQIAEFITSAFGAMKGM